MLSALLSFATQLTALAYVSNSASEEDQEDGIGVLGAAMGSGNSFISLGRIVGPIWAGFIFDIMVRYSYLSWAVIMSAGSLIGLTWISQREHKATVEAWHPAAR